MNTTLKTASTSTILAIDLGKYKSVVRVHDEASGELRFTRFDTTRMERRQNTGQRRLAASSGAALMVDTFGVAQGARQPRRLTLG
jgi:phage tail sheath protein FI